MNHDHAISIDAQLPTHARVVDVGGGAAPFWRADWVIDALPFDAAGKLLRHREQAPSPRYSRDTWVQLDLCDRHPWPFEEGEFDFAVCSHLLEDVRDPLWVCSELSRIAKAGYVEVPSRYVEQSLSVEHPKFAGYHHHRWLISIEDGELVFRHKPHLLHVTRSAIVANLGVSRMISPRHQTSSLFWTNSIRAREALEFEESRIVEELSAYAERARRMIDLVVPNQSPLLHRLRRLLYFRRLARGYR